MMIRAVLISQGHELTTGQTVDANASWLAAQLWNLGIVVRRIITVPDSLTDIRDSFIEAMNSAEIVICTGGLGPTEDDLTAEALAQVLGEPLVSNSDVLQSIQEKFASRERTMNSANTKQALVPDGVEPLPNTRGTAPGLAHGMDRGHLYCLPGVPHEMRAMFTESIAPRLSEMTGFRRPNRRIIQVVGLAESDMARRLEQLNHPEATIGFRTGLRFHEVKLRFAPDVDPRTIEEVVEHARNLLGPRAYGVDCDDLSGIIGQLLVERSQTVATAESCTAGRIATWISETPGASRYLKEGVVVYSNESKVRHCDVDPDVILEHGAVSKEVAVALATGIRGRAGTSWGIGVTGIAGPGGGRPGKPVGTVHICVAGPSEIHHRSFRFHGDRERVSQRSAAEGLYLLYVSIMGLNEP